LGIGDWGLGPIPNPQSPIPNPNFNIINNFYNYNNYNNNYIINKTIKLTNQQIIIN